MRGALRHLYRNAASVTLAGMLLAGFLAGCVPSGPPRDPAPMGFVTRTGSRLMLAGQPFRIAGANIYWLGLDENVGGVNYPSQFRVDDALATAVEMGANVVRSNSLGISVGCALCVEPARGVFNETALDHLDYALFSARQHHLRVIIPLTDSYRFYHGGAHTFTDWRGLSNPALFYYSPTVIGDFEAYISVLLNRVNRYTGVAYKDDPTILAWETGNELDPPVSWTNTISTYLKQQDPQHLVIDGTYGVNGAALALPNVDLYSDHFYPLSVARVNADAALVRSAGKAFVADEYAWNWVVADSLASFLDAVQHDGAAGDLFWSLFGHADNFGYEQHHDGYTLHYPGDTPAMAAAAQLLRAHAFAMRGLSVPPAGLPGTPEITSVAGNVVAWRGVVPAATYRVARSATGPDGPWAVVCDRCATDNSTPWRDATPRPSGIVWYRVQGVNLDGVAGPYSVAAST